MRSKQKFELSENHQYRELETKTVQDWDTNLTCHKQQNEIDLYISVVLDLPTAKVS
jgi:hypothetical protein